MKKWLVVGMLMALDVGASACHGRDRNADGQGSVIGGATSDLTGTDDDRPGTPGRGGISGETTGNTSPLPGGATPEPSSAPAQPPP